MTRSGACAESSRCSQYASHDHFPTWRDSISTSGSWQYSCKY